MSIENTPAAAEAAPDASRVESTVAPVVNGGAPETAEAAKVEADAAAPEKPDEEPKQPPRQKASERISELYGRMKAAERRSAQLEAELQRIQQPLVSQEEYDSLPYDQQQQVAVRAAVRAERAAEIQTEQRYAQEFAQRALVESFQSRLIDAAERIPGIMDAINDPNIPVSEVAATVIYESEQGPEIAYHLAKNPAEARRIASLNPRQQVKELGALEHTLRVQAQPRKISNAPKPAPMVAAGGGSGAKDPASMTYKEYEAYRKGR